MIAPKRTGILLLLGAVLAATLSACTAAPGPLSPSCDPDQPVDITSPYPVETSPPQDSPAVVFDLLEHVDIPRSDGAQLSATVYVGMSHFYLGVVAACPRTRGR